MLLQWKRMATNPLMVFSCIILGFITAIFLPLFAISLKPISTIFTSLLQMCAMPLIFTGIITSLGRLLSSDQGKHIVVRSFLLIFGALVVTSILTILMIKIMGVYGDFSNIAEKKQYLEKALKTKSNVEHSKVALFLNFATTLVPENVFVSFYKEDVLSLVFFTVNFGIALGLIHPLSRTAVAVTEAFFQSFLKIVGWFMYVLPVGVFSSVASSIAEMGGNWREVLYGALSIVLLFHFFCLLQTVGAILIISYRRQVHPWTVFYGFRSAISITCFVNAFLGMIPTIATLTNDLKVDRKITGLVIPLGVMLFHTSYVSFVCIISFFSLNLAGLTPDPFAFLFIFVGSVFLSFPYVGGMQLLPKQSDAILHPLGASASSLQGIAFGLALLVAPIGRLANLMTACALVTMLDKPITPVKQK